MAEPTRNSDERALCPIVLAIDEAYGMPLATTLRSLVEACPRHWPIECFVLSDGVRAETQRKIAASLPAGSALIRWIAVELAQFEGFSTLGHIAKVTYARFLLPRLLPEDTSKVLYLDSDLLVLDDLAPLCQAELDAAALGAVSDAFLDSATKDDSPEVVGVPRVRSYFNAGVLLIDLERWKASRIHESAMEYMARHPESPYSDQDALNVACDGLWKPLDSRWNVQDYDRVRGTEPRDGRRPGILHFTTHKKPWMAEQLSVHAELYDGFRSRTRFARTRLARLLDTWRNIWARGIRYLGLLRERHLSS